MYFCHNRLIVGCVTSIVLHFKANSSYLCNHFPEQAKVCEELVGKRSVSPHVLGITIKWTCWRVCYVTDRIKCFPRSMSDCLWVKKNKWSPDCMYFQQNLMSKKTDEIFFSTIWTKQIKRVMRHARKKKGKEKKQLLEK